MKSISFNKYKCIGNTEFILQLLFSYFGYSYQLKVLSINFSINELEVTARMKKCPKKYVSFISQITFNWFSELIFKGYRKPLTSEDMWYLDNHNTTDYIHKKFNKIWLNLIEKQTKSKTLKNKQKPFYMNITTPLLKCYWMQLLSVNVFKLTAICLTFINPIVLDRLISFMSPSNAEPQWRGLFYASLMFIAPLVESLFNSQHEYRVNVIAMKIRATLISSIYKKVVTLVFKNECQCVYNKTVN
ncbi:unnamed protein product [Medioppia subpectinata]|uniref:ABC transmembrane type-1 domain-containing protein n=1 Tax=Medioppia subpectinata TaxID=1979941 RepID=A0A7R9KW91_9ACAR|nr:unnamed protein product [Medioppia subpectinata]CAG2109650.1 unnamed protein product [Medioppia subpectinata]